MMEGLRAWTQAAWWEAATGWIIEQLKNQGLTLAGPIEQPHVRPWSTVLRVPSSQGVLFFKATALVLVYEPGLPAALAAWRPDCMPEVLAADTLRGWLLMRDGRSRATMRAAVSQNTKLVTEHTDLCDWD